MKRFDVFVKWLNGDSDKLTEDLKMVFKWDNEKNKGCVDCYEVEKCFGTENILHRSISRHDFEWARQQGGEFLATMLLGA